MRRRKTKPVNWFILGIIALPLYAVAAYFWSTGMISALENYRSPLAEKPPEPGRVLGAALSDRVVIVMIDALRLDTSMDNSIMPELNHLRSIGASAIMSSKPPSYSAPGWATLLTGAWPDLNDSQPFNPPDDLSTRSFTQDDIFAAAERMGLRTAVSGYIWFEQMLVESGVDTGFYTPEEDRFADVEVVDSAMPWLLEDYHLLLIHLDQVDYAGHHEGGPLDQRWSQAASRVDTLLAQIVDQLDLETDTLIVLSDHGQIDKGGHGGDEALTLLEPFVAVGKGIIPGEYPGIQMADVASTIAVILGSSIPASSQGSPILEMVDLSTEQRTTVMDLLSAQQEALNAAYAVAIGQPARLPPKDTVFLSAQANMETARSTRLGQERVWRNIISLFLALLPGYVIVVSKNKRILWLLLSAGLYILLFLIQYMILDKNTFHFSWITGMQDFIVYMLKVSGISFVIAWLTTMLFQGAFKVQPIQSVKHSLAISWFILYILSFPVLLNFAINGLVTTWTLPEFSILYFGFFSLVQSLFISALGLLMASLSAVISKVISIINHPPRKL